MEKLQRSGYLCNPQQAYTLRRVTITEGKARGINVIEIATAGGLQIDVLPDLGLDIGQVRFLGANMTFISKNGYDNPETDIPYESEFLNTFPGGLLYTCGMRNTGPGHRDGSEWQPFHGRYHSIPAEHVCVDVEDDVIILKGVVRETALFGHQLELKRTIRIPVFGAEITVNDTVTNLGFQPEEYVLLYHSNFGYPMISEHAHLNLPEKRRTTPRTPFAETGLGREHAFDAPTPGEEERVFFHEDMERRVELVNEKLGAAMEMTWSETLPILAHWRSMAAGDYALGLEPSNNYIMGRAQERANGTLPVLGSFESVKTEVKYVFRKI